MASKRAWSIVPSVRPDGVPPHVPREYWQTYVDMTLLLGSTTEEEMKEVEDDDFDDVPF